FAIAVDRIWQVLLTEQPKKLLSCAQVASQQFIARAADRIASSAIFIENIPAIAPNGWIKMPQSPPKQHINDIEILRRDFVFEFARGNRRSESGWRGMSDARRGNQPNCLAALFGQRCERRKRLTVGQHVDSPVENARSATPRTCCCR